MRNRIESNRRYYDKKLRRLHAGKLTALCRQVGTLAKAGELATCKTCLMIEKTRVVGKRINEWERKRLDALFRARAREKSAAWRKANPQKAREASMRWRAKYRDVHRVSCREWAEKNREHRRAYNAAWWANKRQAQS